MGAITLLLVLGVGWNLVNNLVLPGAWYVPASMAAAAIVLAVAVGAGATWSELGFARADLARGVLYGIAAMAVIAGVIALALLVPALRGFFEDEAVAADSTLDHWFVPLVEIPLGTVVTEEIFFRSALLALFLRLTRPITAIVVTSALFGLWHIVPAAEGASGGTLATAGEIVGTVVITALAGLGFALLRIRSGSIVAAILAHTATNSFAYAAALIALAASD